MKVVGDDEHLQADVPASTSIPFSDIDRLEVVTADGAVLSTLTPRQVVTLLQ